MLFHDLEFGYIYYRDYRVCLISGVKQEYSINFLVEKLDTILIDQDFDSPYIVHLAYEFGFITQDLTYELLNDTPLAIELCYQKSRRINPIIKDGHQTKLTFKNASFNEYKKQFNKVYEQLLKGNCYQVNLTKRYQVQTANALNLFTQKAMRHQLSHPAYEHGSYFPKLSMGILSYSPECLFHLLENDKNTMKIESMPIKGTKKRGTISDQLLWQELINDEKEEAELNMITDLIRNDIARLCDYQSTVATIKSPLILPQILHQFSRIYGFINKEKTLLDLISALFPGGSITGAPKKNVMKIIKDIELSPRRFYCGSTLIFHKKLRRASINIRTIEFDFHSNILKIGSGGGVTLKSKAKSEFLEMENKFHSVLGYLQ